jgi:ABC-type transport system involved in cytochrome c biogenesis permease component
MLTLLKKDILLEIRRADLLLFFSSLGFLIAVILSVIIGATPITPSERNELFLPFFFLTPILLTLLAGNQIYLKEFTNGSSDHLKLLGVKVKDIVKSKSIVLLLLLFIAQIFNVVTMLLFGNLAIFSLANFSLLSATFIFALSALSAVVGFVMWVAPPTRFLYPLVVTPLLLPLIGILLRGSDAIIAEKEIYSSSLQLFGIGLLYLWIPFAISHKN